MDLAVLPGAVFDLHLARPARSQCREVFGREFADGASVDVAPACEASRLFQGPHPSKKTVSTPFRLLQFSKSCCFSLSGDN